MAGPELSSGGDLSPGMPIVFASTPHLLSKLVPVCLLPAPSARKACADFSSPPVKRRAVVALPWPLQSSALPPERSRKGNKLRWWCSACAVVPGRRLSRVGLLLAPASARGAGAGLGLLVGMLRALPGQGSGADPFSRQARPGGSSGISHPAGDSAVRPRSQEALSAGTAVKGMGF